MVRIFENKRCEGSLKNVQCRMQNMVIFQLSHSIRSEFKTLHLIHTKRKFEPLGLSSWQADGAFFFRLTED